jgi:hypothetical protein
LIKKFPYKGLDVFSIDVIRFGVLVDGAWNNDLQAELWYWNLFEASSIYYINLGARLIKIN